MSTPKGAAIILKDFFGLKEGQTAMGFMQEVKALTEDEKLDLARAAAKAIGLSQDALAFELK